MTFKELAEKRFSARAYTDEAVSKEDLHYIMECVRLAPSATNKQPWKFLVITSEEGKNHLRACYDRPWFATAQTYILCMKAVDGCWVRASDHKQHGDIDLAIAIEHLCLAAAERGLGTCWVCNYDVDAVKKHFPVEGYEAVALIPVGHIAPSCPHAPKKRKELADIMEEI